MTEKTVKDADKTMIENDGHRRFAESVDPSKTPEEELKDPRRGKAGRSDAIIK
jgi:hypothetical protein